MRSPASQNGLVLLEVIVGLTIMAVGATAVIALASASLGAVSRTDAAEQHLRRANALMDAVSLWPKEDLDRHLGDRPEGAWRLRVDRPDPTLYVVRLSDDATGRMLFETSIFRDEQPDAAR